MQISTRKYPKLKEVDDVLGGAAAWENVDHTEGMLLFITSHVSDECNSFGIIILCVCLSCSHGRTDRRIDLNFGMKVKMEGYLGQVQRSRSPGQKRFLL